MTLDPLRIVTLFAAWGAFLWFSEVRTARTVLLLLVATLVVVVADTLPPPWPSVVALAVATALIAVHLRFNRLISAHTPRELEFRARFVAINDRLQEAYKDYGSSGDRGSFRDALAIAHREIGSLRAPAPEWEEVQHAALELLSDRIQIHDVHRELDPKVRMQFRSDRAELQEKLRVTVQRTAKFWR